MSRAFFWLFAFCLLSIPLQTSSAESLRKLSEVKRGAIGSFGLTALNFGLSGLFVTAVSDTTGNLKIFVWANTETEPRAIISAGRVRDIAVAPLTGKRFITAVRDSDDRLRVIAWAASSDGRTVTRLSTDVGPTVREVEAAASTSGITDEVFISARRPNGDLLVTTARMLDNDIDLREGLTFGGASTLALSAGVTSGLAFRDSTGKLRLTQLLGGGGDGIARGGTNGGGTIVDVDVSSFGVQLTGEWVTFTTDPGPTGVRTAFSCSHRTLLGHGLGKLIAWEKDRPSIHAGFERIAERTFEGRGGVAKAVALESIGALPGRMIITGHLGFGDFCKLLAKDRGKPRAELILWRFNNQFEKRTQTTLGGDYTDLEIVEIARGPDDARFAMALRGKGGELKVTVWAVDR